MFASGLTDERAKQKLDATLGKERLQWKPILPRPVSSAQEITDMERDKEAFWLIQLSQSFDFAPETYALAISIMDRVSTLVKIRPKYLRCVAISCLYIAAKTLEDDEAIPVTLDLVRKSQCGCSVSEILRMELVILTKLDWNPKAVTAIDFLHLIHYWTMRSFPYLLTHLKNMTPSRFLALLTRKLLTLLCHANIARDRPSVVALALVSLELEQVVPQHWLQLNLMMQGVIQAENGEVISCRERMAWLLDQCSMLITGYQEKPVSSAKSKKRKVEDLESDNIYDGIKRLYEESGTAPEKLILPKRGSCASEMHLDSEDIHPFVQTVAAV
ncbi:cyclin-I-like [Babylonia areolata]|uniref:cyclin-I-like n=1 Tax=Babylonia areolata TaxID=304850 RepID=UPI003FD66116